MGIHLNFCGINFLFKQFPTIFKLRREIKLKRTKTNLKMLMSHPFTSHCPSNISVRASIYDLAICRVSNLENCLELSAGNTDLSRSNALFKLNHHKKISE